MDTVIVRHRPQSRQTGFGLGPGLGASSIETEPPQVTIQDISVAERDALERSSDFLVADPMPLSLIDPLRNIEAAAPTQTPADFADVLDDQGTNAWGVPASGALESDFDGSGVKVAVLDTGIDADHPAFPKDQIQLLEKNFSSDADGFDNNGHGTHCAGTIFGRDVDGLRIGVARGVSEALIAKVIPGTLADLIRAIQWSTDNGAKIVSMSLGYDFPGWVNTLVRRHDMQVEAATSRALRDYRNNILALDATLANCAPGRLTNDGVLVLAASGNESKRSGASPYVISASPPSVSDHIVGVGALGRADGGLKVTSFSNTDPDVSAPGLDVLSARASDPGLTVMSGTSMACPHAAGLAALYWQQAREIGRPRLASTVRNQLEARASYDGIVTGWLAQDVGQGQAIAP